MFVDLKLTCRCVYYEREMARPLDELRAELGVEILPQS